MSSTTNLRPAWGLAAFIFGVLALASVTFHVSGIFSAPERSAATQIGEFAAEIRESARRALADEQATAPQPSSSRWDADRVLLFAVPGLASLAAILGAIGLFRREAPALPGIAIALGCGAFVMQYAFWLAVVVGGLCLLIAIVRNLDGIFGT